MSARHMVRFMLVLGLLARSACGIEVKHLEGSESPGETRHTFALVEKDALGNEAVVGYMQQRVRGRWPRRLGDGNPFLSQESRSWEFGSGTPLRDNIWEHFERVHSAMTALMAERLGYDLPFLSQLLGPHRVEAQSDDGTGLLEQKLARTHDEGGQAEEGSTNPALAAATVGHAGMPFLPTLPPGGADALNWSLLNSDGKPTLGCVLFCVLCAACIGMLAIGPIARLLGPRGHCVIQGNASRSCSHAKAPPELVAPLIPPGERECMCKHDGCSWISRGEY